VRAGACTVLSKRFHACRGRGLSKASLALPFFRNPIVTDNYHEPKIVSRADNGPNFGQNETSLPEDRRLRHLRQTDGGNIEVQDSLAEAPSRGRSHTTERSQGPLNKKAAMRGGSLKKDRRRKSGPHSWQRDLPGVRADPGPRIVRQGADRPDFIEPMLGPWARGIFRIESFRVA
jgi:hypothetical protein